MAAMFQAIHVVARFRRLAKHLIKCSANFHSGQPPQNFPQNWQRSGALIVIGSILPSIAGL